MQYFRWEILNIIKKKGKLTVNDIAEKIGLAPITVRHHLSILEKEGLISAELLRGKTGRPSHQYILTEKALEFFPKNYHRLADRILTYIKDTESTVDINKMFERISRAVIPETRPVIKGKILRDNLDILLDFLNREGYMAEVEKKRSGYIINIYNCPYSYISKKHPELCTMDRGIIERVLNTKIKQISSSSGNGTNCGFKLSIK